MCPVLKCIPLMLSLCEDNETENKIFNDLTAKPTLQLSDKNVKADSGI
jgi:hypothetical protein